MIQELYSKQTPIAPSATTLHCMGSCTVSHYMYLNQTDKLDHHNDHYMYIVLLTKYGFIIYVMQCPSYIIVSRGQTLFCTEGKGLGFGHRATCCPTLWSAYQSQHSIQSHDTWSMWSTGKFKISVWIEHEPEAWEVRTEREVSWDISWNTAESKLRVQKGRKSYFPIIFTIAMWRHGWIYMTN